MAERANRGFEKVELLAGNVGYVKFNMFADPAPCSETAIAAMNFLAHVGAIIFDLRDNGGGDPAMIALISTYLFGQPTHLNDIWTRKTGVARFPVVSLSAEYLVMGCLLRRNILTYKAPGNEGYDLICIHPDPRKAARQLRVQVESRMATDSDRGFPVKAKTIDAFDFLIVAFLNVGYYFSKAKRHSAQEGACEPEFFTLTPEFIREHHDPRSSWEKLRTRGLDLSQFKNELGFELIAKSLGVPFPSKANKPATQGRRANARDQAGNA